MGAESTSGETRSNLGGRSDKGVAKSQTMGNEALAEPQPERSNASVSSPDWEVGADYIVENQRPLRLSIRGNAERFLTLAPLERRVLAGEALEPFDRRRLETSNELSVKKKTIKEGAAERLQVFGLLGLFLYAVVGSAVTGALQESLGAADSQLWVRLYWFGVPVLAVVALLIIWASSRRGGVDLVRWMKQTGSLFLVLLTAVAIPGVVIWYGTGLAIAAQADSSLASFLETPQFVARALQVVFISTASLLPALMYFLFDREQLGTLRDRFVQQVFRLDPSLERLSDMEAKYGPQMEEMYGQSQITRARLLGGRLSPIFVATLLVSIGWTLTLLNASVRPSPNGGFRVLDLFVPETSVVTFAFLGAYFFAVQLVLRGYMRGDLRPKSYSHISVRILIVVILAWVLEQAVGAESPGISVMVFLAGIVPETALRWVREAVTRWRRGSNDDVSDLDELAPLTRIEGIDLYDRTRLVDEGVTNVEALAHHELVDLILRTRIPVPRLVDWLDQAILYLHVRAPKRSDDGVEDRLSDRLRSYGIRTATDLIAACNSRPAEEREKLYEALEGVECEGPHRVEVIVEALLDDEWLQYVRHWRKQPDLATTAMEVDATF